MENKEDKKDNGQTFGDWWEESKSFNIFDIPEGQKIADKAGIYTINIPISKDETIVQEVEVHEDLNYSIISEKTVKTGKRATKKTSIKEKKTDATTDKSAVATKNVDLKKD